jgi:hypothetical protein
MKRVLCWFFGHRPSPNGLWVSKNGVNYCARCGDYAGIWFA